MPRIRSVALQAMRRPLAASLAALCGVSASAAHATAFVTNCNDSGSGSLRGALTEALSGETVNATGLAGVCSTITLTTGAISTTKTNVKIIGPGKNSLTVTAGIAGTSRLFMHTGSGTFEADDVTLSKGYVLHGEGETYGGCIFSNGNVVLKNASVLLCTASAPSGPAAGGAIYAHGFVYLLNSVISGNSARGGPVAAGGGIRADTGFTAKYSTISNNTASDATNSLSAGGGIYARGSGIFIHHTTISGNTAGHNDGALLVHVTGNATLFDSTISNNRALLGTTGGAHISANTLTLYNSTIAANAANAGTLDRSAGLMVQGTGTSPKMTIESTLIANNTYGSAPDENDLSASGFTISGHNNLVRVSSAGLPADTIVGQCPLLGPLRSNGGPTQTHALFSHSAAIDAGNNSGGLLYDQRGAPHVRASGPPGTASPVADIGAYELDQLDVVFTAGFEGCP